MQLHTKIRMGPFSKQHPNFGLMKLINPYKQLRPNTIWSPGAYQQQHSTTDAVHSTFVDNFTKTFSASLPVWSRRFTTSSLIRKSSCEGGKDGEGKREEDGEKDGEEDEGSASSSKYPTYAGERHVPGVHHSELKGQGRNAGWEDIRVVLTLHLDKQNRKRRVWFTFDGPQPTKAELKLAWPHGGKTIARRKLRDDEEDVYRPVIEAMDEPREFIVSEKTSSEGRKFWREIIKRGESNDEEGEEEWHEWMEEEGHFKEIERLMQKD
ncbi:MAG: hypothetical protein OHK93_002424 [Ramalina farinacea]|uniref:Uncharacterized protein n=1 Tax=Ramalina farinacea TaxID=258253 RepID=A0AA43QRI6_9LECA|nr:hypothetical protein [Ramalina farinacea]